VPRSNESSLSQPSVLLESSLSLLLGQPIIKDPEGALPIHLVEVPLEKEPQLSQPRHDRRLKDVLLSGKIRKKRSVRVPIIHWYQLKPRSMAQAC